MACLLIEVELQLLLGEQVEQFLAEHIEGLLALLAAKAVEEHRAVRTLGVRQTAMHPRYCKDL